MKNLLKTVLLCFITVSILTANLSCLASVTLYSLDGRSITVEDNAVDGWKAVGWYEYDDVTVDLWAYDAEKIVKITIFVWEADKYKAVGWYDDIRYVPVVMYSDDGRTITVHFKDFGAYSRVGWYGFKSLATKTLYSADGRSITVWNSEAPTYIKLGWGETPPAYIPSSADVFNELSTDFPLSLYSNDASTYLGKLTTNSYDTESIWNKYGTYGSEYSRYSIWNTYGTYGSEYSSESAFNDYASKPPAIVDKKGKICGYLTTNEYKLHGYTIAALRAFLISHNQ